MAPTESNLAGGSWHANLSDDLPPGLDIIRRGITETDNLFRSALELFSGDRDQIMYFGTGTAPFPRVIHDVIVQLSPLMPAFFSESLPLQCIVNLYRPGEGISDHVDLPHRYSHTVIGVSLGSSCLFRLKKNDSTMEKEYLLSPGDIYVLSGEARYHWTHGIPSQEIDVIHEHQKKIHVRRTTRISITLRKMLPGSDVVGSGDDDAASLWGSASE